MSKFNFRPLSIARILLGLIYALAGFVGLFNLAPPPENLPADMMTFMGGIMAAKYFFPLLKLTELICGVMLVARLAPALALVILAPITLNILLVHGFLTPGIENLILPVVIVGLHVAAMAAYKAVYMPLLARN